MPDFAVEVDEKLQGKPRMLDDVVNGQKSVGFLSESRRFGLEDFDEVFEEKSDFFLEGLSEVGDLFFSIILGHQSKKSHEI